MGLGRVPALHDYQTHLDQLDGPLGGRLELLTSGAVLFGDRRHRAAVPGISARCDWHECNHRVFGISPGHSVRQDFYKPGRRLGKSPPLRGPLGHRADHRDARVAAALPLVSSQSFSANLIEDNRHRDTEITEEEIVFLSTVVWGIFRASGNLQSL